MGLPSAPELLIVLGIVVLLFGAKKIPDLAKGLGKGIKDFKKELNDTDTAEIASDTKPSSDDNTIAVEGSVEPSSTKNS